MLKIINTTGGALTSGTPITFTQKFNSNNNVSFNNNTITINKAGFYAIDVNLVITATATTTGFAIYNNGTMIPETAVSSTTESASVYEFVINDKEKVSPTYLNENAKLTIVPTTAGTLVRANVSVYEIR